MEGTDLMADPFADHLRSEMYSIQAELERLAAKRRLIEALLSLESGGAAPDATTTRTGRSTARKPAQATKRARRPRGLITGKVREFLGARHEPAHATEILAYLEREDAAPLSTKPIATLQSALQRLKEQGEVENTGRNRWRLRAAAAEAANPTPPEPGPPVVTSTTTFGGRPPAGQ